MAEVVNQSPGPSMENPEQRPVTTPQKPQRRGPPLHQIYSRPAPIRTFPLPTFYPNNPISLFHLVSTWIGQIIRPPPAEPSIKHIGRWSPATFSVHVTDPDSMRALWEQGFYGKGNLSRSEPNWLKREQVRRGVQEGHVSELHTLQRREERQKAKWERARLEQEAILQTRLEEARLGKNDSSAAAVDVAKKLTLPGAKMPPVGPLELLALPNSLADLRVLDVSVDDGPAPVEPLDETQSDDTSQQPSHTTSLTSPADSPDASSDAVPFKRQKSVRFSPKVESATFNLLDPPSPSLAASQVQTRHASSEQELSPNKSQPSPTENDGASIVNKEHLQLTPEEAFFLVFGFGVLTVIHPETGHALTTPNLLQLFRQYSYFPPRLEADDAPLRSDDNFLVHYAVYHHFRSLGWVPRPGVKFGVDWLLYTRGPVFDHAEFGLVVIPSYSDPGWAGPTKPDAGRSWHWMHGVLRVLSHVTKSLVLVYVDVPSPAAFDEAMEGGFAQALRLYKVREVMVKRWSSNRNR